MLYNQQISDLFGADLAAIREPPRPPQGHATSRRTPNRHQMRRANSEAHLADVLPAVIAPGETWHVISRGDVDAMSYLAHAIAGAGYLDHVLISTWVFARTDVEQLAAWLDAGTIDTVEMYVGEIFPNQYPDEWEAVQELSAEYGIRLIVARNHSKIMLASQSAADLWLVMEGSANVNTNPRIEQTAITRDRGLHDFYADFFHGLKSIDRASRR